MDVSLRYLEALCNDPLVTHYDPLISFVCLLKNFLGSPPHQNIHVNTTFPQNLLRFLVVDTRSVETTIAVGQIMQMCHSLRCKQIDRLTGTQLISIQ